MASLLSAKQQLVVQARGAACPAMPRLPPRRPAAAAAAALLGRRLGVAPLCQAHSATTPFGAAPCVEPGAEQAARWDSTAQCSSSSTGTQQQQHHHHHQERQQQQQRGGQARPAAAPFASLTRVLLTSQAPSNLVRQLIAGRSRFAGPVGLLLFLCGLLLAVLSGVRAALVRRVKACQCCRGYGIVRCRLCDGRGSVEWMGECRVRVRVRVNPNPPLPL